MPWCPKCKAEFQDGYTICSDCNVELVDELPEEEDIIPVFASDDKEIAEKLMRYFDYSKFNGAVLTFNEGKKVYTITVPSEIAEKAKELYQAFYYVERKKLEEKLEEGKLSEVLLDDSEPEDIDENPEDMDENLETDSAESDETTDSETESENDLSDEKEAVNETVTESELQDFKKMDDVLSNEGVIENEEHIRSTSSAYVMKADQYKDLSSTVWVFLLFGLVGLIFVLLNVTKVIHIFSNPLPNIVMGVLFLFFVYVGLSTYKKAKQVQSGIDAENQLTQDINEWLNNNITNEFVASHRDDSISEELSYIKLFDAIKEMLIKEFGNQNTSYLDRLIEEFYSNKFENAGDSEE